MKWRSLSNANVSLLSKVTFGTGKIWGLFSLIEGYTPVKKNLSVRDMEGDEIILKHCCEQMII